jgi:hypothetical protein
LLRLNGHPVLLKHKVLGFDPDRFAVSIGDRDIHGDGGEAGCIYLGDVYLRLLLRALG